MSPIETVIVGAGPYGLSIAAHLKAAGKSFRIIGQSMDSWRNHMPKGMLLKSECFASSLWDPARKFTYKRFCGTTGRKYFATGQPVPLEDFVEYARWFEIEAGLDVLDVRLNSLLRADDRFELQLGNGETWRAERVILATGHAPFARVPEVFADVTHGRVLHSYDVNDPDVFRGRSVTVIGGGQGSLETAALCAEAGANVRVLVRDPAVDFNRPPRTRSWIDKLLKPEAGLAAGWRSLFYSELPRLFRALPAELRAKALRSTFGPAGSWWLRDRVVGHVDLLVGHEVIGASEDATSLALLVRTPSGERAFTTDVVIAGTGFQPSLEKLGFLSDELRAQVDTREGYPILDAEYQSTVRRLHFVGLASAQSFGPVMRFMYGAKHAAAALAAIT